MKKTLLVTVDFYPQLGGVANYYLNLCLNLDKEKIVVLTEGGAEGDAPFKVYRKKLFFSFIWPKWLLMMLQIYRVVKKEKIEMIWVGDVIPTGAAVYFLTKLLKVPYIVSCHGNDILQARRLKRREKMARMVLNKARKVTVNSQYTSKLIRSLGVENQEVNIIYPGVNEFRGDLSGVQKTIIDKLGLKNKNILLSIGRLVERKGFDRVIESLPQVVREMPDLIYLIAGDGPDRARLEKLGGGQVKFLGRVAEEEKWALMDLCDLFIMPARESQGDVEGFGIVYLEAGVSGKAVIAGNVGGAREAVVDGLTGLLVDPEKTDEIGRAIIKLFRDNELREKMGRAGRERVLGEFSWSKITGDFRRICE